MSAAVKNNSVINIMNEIIIKVVFQSVIYINSHVFEIKCNNKLNK